MKKILFVVALICHAVAGAQTLGFFEDGALNTIEFDAAAVNKEKKQTISNKDIYSSLAFSNWVKGWLSGSNSSPVLTRQKSNGLNFPEAWMFDSEKFAPSVLAFIKENKPSDFPKGKESGRGSDLLIAWYLKNHPSASEFERTVMSQRYVRRFFDTEKIEQEREEERVLQMEKSH